MTHITNWLFAATILYLTVALVSATLTLVQKPQEENMSQGMDKLDSDGEGNQPRVGESMELQCFPKSDSNNIAPMMQPDAQSNDQRVNTKIILQQCSVVDVDILPQNDGNHLTVEGACDSSQKITHKHRNTGKLIKSHQDDTTTAPMQITLSPGDPEMTNIPHLEMVSSSHNLVL